MHLELLQYIRYNTKLTTKHHKELRKISVTAYHNDCSISSLYCNADTLCEKSTSSGAPVFIYIKLIYIIKTKNVSIGTSAVDTYKR